MNQDFTKKEAKERNVYFLKKDNRFYNSKDKYFYHSITNATYEVDPRRLKRDMNLVEELSCCEIYPISESELFSIYSAETINVILSGSYFANKLSSLDDKIPTISKVSKEMKNRSKSMVKLLKPLVKEYDRFIEKEEENTDKFMGDYEEFLRNMSSIEIYQMEKFNLIFKRINKNRK